MQRRHRPLHAAAESRHIAVAEHLAARKAEASSADSDGGEPLHVATGFGHVAVAVHLAVLLGEEVDDGDVVELQQEAAASAAASPASSSSCGGAQA